MRRPRGPAAQDQTGVSERQDADVSYRRRPGLQVQEVCAVTELDEDAIQRREESAPARPEAPQEPTAQAEARQDWQGWQETPEGQQETPASARRDVNSLDSMTVLVAAAIITLRRTSPL